MTRFPAPCDSNRVTSTESLYINTLLPLHFLNTTVAMSELLCSWLRVLALQSQFKLCSRHSTEQALIESAATSYSDPWRPQVHYTPEANWLNDPNGLFKDDDGLWHLYYQCGYP